MKKKILSVLTVLMAVLMCVLTLCACSNEHTDGAQTSTAEEIIGESRADELIKMAFSVTGMWLDGSTSRDFALPEEIRPEGMLNCFYNFADEKRFYDSATGSYRFTADDVNAFVNENFYNAYFDPAKITLADGAFQPEADGFTFVKSVFSGHDNIKQSVLISEISPDYDFDKIRVKFALGELDAPETPSDDKYVLTLYRDAGKYRIYSLESDAPTVNYTYYSQEQLDFWSSDCGKSAQERLCGDYTLVVKDYGGVVLYMNGLGVYAKASGKEVQHIIDAPFVYPPRAYFSDGKITVPADDGELGAGCIIGNFPYDFVYDLSAGEGHIEMRAIGGERSCQHTVHAGGVTDGHFGEVKITDGAAEIYFDIDFTKQGGADFSFPGVDYIYDSHSRTAVFYFGCVRCDEAAAALAALEQLEGVSDVRYEEYASADEYSVAFGTKLSFRLDEGCLLYGEVFASGDSKPTDHYRLWTEKAG